MFKKYIVFNIVFIVTIVLNCSPLVAAELSINAVRQINHTISGNVPATEGLSVTTYEVLHSKDFITALNKTLNTKIYKDYKIKILEDTAGIFDNKLYAEAYLENSNVGIDIIYNLDTHYCSLEYADTIAGNGVGIIGLQYLPENVPLDLIQDYIDPNGYTTWFVQPNGIDLIAINVHNKLDTVPIGLEH